MRKLVFSGVIVLFVAATAAFAAAPDSANGFTVRNDKGETVRVLPPPASVNANPDSKGQPTYAPDTGYAVYKASYGVGNLLDHGGLEIANAGFYQVYYGPSVTSEFGTGIDGFINAFGSGVTDYNIITQYGSAATISATLTNVGYYNDPNTAPSSISDTGVQNYLAGLFANHGVPAASNVVYGVYLPKGTVSSIGNSYSCGGPSVSYCGYHSHFTYNGLQVKYAVFPYNDCSGCLLSGKRVIDMQTIVTSHEIREAVTDPGDNGKNAWYDRRGYEADDKCAWHHLYQLQGVYWVQPEYSNNDGGCVVP